MIFFVRIFFIIHKFFYFGKSRNIGELLSPVSLTNEGIKSEVFDDLADSFIGK